MTNDFLLEIGCEELPPKSLLKLVKALAEGIKEGLNKAELQFEQVQYFAAPRRLAVQVCSLEQAQADKEVLRKGPAVAAAYDKEGKPTGAALGFAKSCGAELTELNTIKEAKGEYLAYKLQQTGRLTIELLEDIVNSAVKKLPIPKPMRWGAHDIHFVRPVHWLLMLYGNSIVPATVLGKKAANRTYGHRFHHPQAITIEEPGQYLTKLEQASVLADFAKRRAIIQQQITECANACQAQVIENSSLLDEVTAIVEWPQAILVDFDKPFLEVPKEALIESMASHQKCFSLQNSHGELLPHFITVANIESQEISHVIKGNERVMRARLSDANFFYQKDKETTLESKSQVLKNIVFQKQLGSMQDKVSRVENLAVYIAKTLNFDVLKITRAALLSKASLVTEMVGEFPSLQDVMGYYYAKYDGEDGDVALALQEQYLPRFSGDALPTSDCGVALALADRIDTLVGIFGINQKPSGVKDPFQLRRAALGVIRILLEGEYSVTISELLEASLKTFRVELNNQQVLPELNHFIADRLYHYLTTSLNVKADVAKAVMTITDLSVADVVARSQALQPFVQSEEAETLIQGFKRVSNILKAAQKQAPVEGEINPALLVTEEEQVLYQETQHQQQQLITLLANRDYGQALIALSALKKPVDDFFEKVMVNVEQEDLKQNRLLILTKLRQLFSQFADLSLIQ